MTELFTLLALGAAFGWVFAKVLEPLPPFPGSFPTCDDLPEVERIRKKILQAERELNNKNYFEGLKIFKELKKELENYKDKFSHSEKIGIDHSLRLCLEQLAEGLIKGKVYDQALPLLKEAYSISKGDMNILKKIVRLNLALEQKEEAIKNLEKIIKKEPSFLEGYRRIASLYIETDQGERAVKIFQDAVNNFPDESRIRLEMLERISLCTPASHPAKLTRLKSWAEELIREKNFSKAEEVINESIKIYPQNTSLTVELSKIHYKLGRLDNVRENLKEITQENPKNLEVKYYLGATYFHQNEIDKALVFFNQIINFEKNIQPLPPEEKIKRLQSSGLQGSNNAQLTGSYHSILYQTIALAGEIYRRRGMLEQSEQLFLELLQKGIAFVDEHTLTFLSALARDFAVARDEREHYWQARMEQLGASISRKKQAKNSYEDFWLRFQPSEPGDEDMIGEGGMAIVYRGVELKTGRKVAIKKMHRQFCQDQGARSFFHKEVGALETLSYPQAHPNIVEFIAHGISDDRFVFAMELVEGKSLRDKLLAGEINSREQIFSIICQICSGLKRAHEDEKKIIHRDLKPENILITNEGISKITDFGICRVSSLSTSARQHYQRTRSFVGTSYYSAPEQYPDPFDGQLPPIDQRADIYSLGCVIYEMLTTQPPFVHDDPGIVGLMHQRRKIGENPAPQIIPPSIKNPLLLERLELKTAQILELDRVVMKCLQKSPLARYQSVEELEKDFTKISLI